jgi:hypothetical protein
VDRSDYPNRWDRLAHFLEIVAGVGLGVLIGGYFLLLIWSHLEAPVSTTSAVASPSSSICSVQPGADVGHDVAVEFTGNGAEAVCQELVGEGWQQLLPAPGSGSICTLTQGGVTAVVWDTGSATYGTQECTIDLPGRGWSPAT